MVCRMGDAIPNGAAWDMWYQLVSARAELAAARERIAQLEAQLTERTENMWTQQIDADAVQALPGGNPWQGTPCDKGHPYGVGMAWVERGKWHCADCGRWRFET